MSLFQLNDIVKKKRDSFAIINEDRLNMECFLIRRAFESQCADTQVPNNSRNRNSKKNIKENNPERSHSPPVRDRPFPEKSLKNITRELLDKMMNKIYILTQFIKNSNTIAKNSVKLLAFNDVDFTTKQKRLDNYITRLQIKLFGLFQQVDNLELFSKNSNNLIVVIRGTVRLLDELNSALTNNYIGGPLDRRIQKIPWLCRRILIYATKIPSIAYDSSNDVEIIDFLEDILKAHDGKYSENRKSIINSNLQRKNTRKPLSKNCHKPRQAEPLPSHKVEKSTKDASIMTENSLRQNKVIQKSAPQVSTDFHQNSKLARPLLYPKDAILEALTRIEANSNIIDQRWNLLKKPEEPLEKEKDLFAPDKKIVVRNPRVVVANVSTLNSFADYKSDYGSYLEGMNYSTFSREISPWSFAARVGDKIWEELINSIVYEVSDVLDDILISEFFSELGCSVDKLLEPAEIENSIADRDLVGIPGFFMNINSGVII